MATKQLLGLGYPMWSEKDIELAKSLLSKVVELSLLPLTILALCSDEGGDERFTRDGFAAAVESIPWIIVLSNKGCWLHQAQLIQKKLLSTADYICKRFVPVDEFCGLGYFSAISTLCNSLRAFAAIIYRVWWDLFGHAAAKANFGKSLVPRALSNRWLAVVNSESWLKRRDWTHLRIVLPKALDRRARAATAAAASRSEPVIEDRDATDSLQAHTEKLGKWSQRSLKIISSQCFYILLNVFHQVHCVLAHLQKWLHKTPDGGHLPNMVWGKNKEFLSQFEQLLLPAAWAELLHDAVPEVLEDSIVFIILFYTCQAACDYSRRFIDQTLRFPDRLFLLTKTHPKEDCPVRRSISGEVLDGDQESLGPDIYKIKVRFRDELLHCKIFGTIQPHFFTFLYKTGNGAVVSTGDIEGTNNTIGWICQNAPHISLPTLSKAEGQTMAQSNTSTTPPPPFTTHVFLARGARCLCSSVCLCALLL